MIKEEEDNAIGDKRPSFGFYYSQAEDHEDCKNGKHGCERVKQVM